MVRLPSPAHVILPVSRSMRPILKRPTPLPLSPSAPAASFSSLLSPSQRAVKSSAAHVRFPSSPSKLVATINTYASDAYDRDPISISPNLVAMPGWGERVYTPSHDGFRLQPTPKIFRSFALAPQASPLLSEFEDPRSPRLQPNADVTGAKAANAIRFAKKAAVQGTPPAHIKPLEKALTPYPRSPYPSATSRGADAEMENRGKRFSKSSDQTLVAARTRVRVQHGQDRSVHNRNVFGLTLNDPIGSDLVPGTGPLPTPSLHRSKKPTPLALESNSADSDKLSNAFWNSVSVESPDQPMVTALEYPESAVQFEEKIDFDIQSASQPPFMFASADGMLFSPGLPKPHSRVEKLRESIQQTASPSVKRSSFVPLARKEVTAPSPNDPFAAFPSFGAVLERLDNPIQYPAPIAQA